MSLEERSLRLAEKCLPNLAVGKSCGERALEARDVKLSKICRLWAGMGHIYQVELWTTGTVCFVMKHIKPPSRKRQSFGDQRKAASYHVECNFYDNLAASLIRDYGLHIPTPYLVEHGPAKEEITICMSLLVGNEIDMSNLEEVKSVLSWLAKFHAVYWGQDQVDRIVQEVGLQAMGSYWHLDTRPEEHGNMSRNGWEGRLKRAARAIDSCLKRDPMQCLIHGDAKKANMMLVSSLHDAVNAREETVAMYDFQYCGRGTPTRDVAYFLCSSCDEDEEGELVEFYYNRLVENLSSSSSATKATIPTLEHFRDSLELALCDFSRFMCGWGHWGYDIQSRVQRFLGKLDGGKDLGSEEAYDEAIRKVLW